MLVTRLYCFHNHKLRTLINRSYESGIGIQGSSGRQNRNNKDGEIIGSLQEKASEDTEVAVTILAKDIEVS
mgnify:CR=1 FL=1